MASNDDTLKVSYTRGGGAGIPPTEMLVVLGKVVSNSQSLEMAVTRILGELLGCDLALALICFYGQNAKAKRETVENLTYQRFKRNDERAKRIRTVMARYKTISTERNYLVHGVWTEKDGKWKRTYLPPVTEQIDDFVGGHAEPERRSKTQSRQATFNYTLKEMGDVLDAMLLLFNDLGDIVDLGLRPVK